MHRGSGSIDCKIISHFIIKRRRRRKREKKEKEKEKEVEGKETAKIGMDKKREDDSSVRGKKFGRKNCHIREK